MVHFFVPEGGELFGYAGIANHNAPILGLVDGLNKKKIQGYGMRHQNAVEADIPVGFAQLGG